MMSKYKIILAAIRMIMVLSLLSGCSHHALYKEKPAFYAYIIGDVKTNAIQLENAADVYATPASCQKTITALLAIKELGKNYYFETKAYVTKKHGKIDDLVLAFSGDPTLTSEGLLSLLTPIINTKINGEIILDLSLFKTPTHSPNIIIGDVGTKYAQPVSSFNLDKNLINVTVIPAELGKLASVYNDSQFKMDANVLTTDDESMVRLVWDLDVIKLSGSINPKDKPLKLQISPQEIDFYALSKVRQILKKLNIRGKLKIVKEQAQLPVHATQLHAIKSMPLQEMLIPGMRESDNLMFDSIYLKLINLQTSAGDWSDGDKKIKSLISKHLGVNVGQALFVDGSGLSRYNRVQPRKLFEILKKGYSVPEFMNSLPYPGERGASVPKIAGLASNIRAKTGRMSGIACLCGYGANKAFVIMVSGFAPHDLMPGISKFISGQVGG